MKRNAKHFMPKLGITVDEVPEIAEQIIKANLELLKNSDEREDVLEWFFRDDDHPLSFTSLCASLEGAYGEFDPEVIRDFLRKNFMEKNYVIPSQPSARERATH